MRNSGKNIKLYLSSCTNGETVVNYYQEIIIAEVDFMMYPYITLADETEIIHSHLLHKDDIDLVEVHFERAVDNGFCSARCILPTYEWKFKEGFSAEEIKFFEEFLRQNAHLLYRYAGQGGIHCA